SAWRAVGWTRSACPARIFWGRPVERDKDAHGRPLTARRTHHAAHGDRPPASGSLGRAPKTGGPLRIVPCAGPAGVFASLLLGSALLGCSSDEGGGGQSGAGGHAGAGRDSGGTAGVAGAGGGAQVAGSGGAMSGTGGEAGAGTGGADDAAAGTGGADDAAAGR